MLGSLKRLSRGSAELGIRDKTLNENTIFAKNSP
jgi:hypothetical protein